MKHSTQQDHSFVSLLPKFLVRIVSTLALALAPQLACAQHGSAGGHFGSGAHFTGGAVGGKLTGPHTANSHLTYIPGTVSRRPLHNPGSSSSFFTTDRRFGRHPRGRTFRMRRFHNFPGAFGFWPYGWASTWEPDCDSNSRWDCDMGEDSSANYSESSEIESRPMIVVHLRDGTGYGALDYWLSNGMLHLETTYGSEKFFPIDQVDMRRTVNENAARSVYFALHDSPLPSDPGSVFAPDSYAPPCGSALEQTSASPPAHGANSSEPSWFGANGIRGINGLTIKSVRAGSAAARVGMQPDDVVLRIDCHQVHSVEDIESAVANANGTVWVAYLVKGAWLTEKKFTIQ